MQVPDLQLGLRVVDVPPETREQLEEALQSLTDIERAVVFLILDGQPNKYIAKRLNVAMRTVEAHRATALAKLGASSPVELAIRVSSYYWGKRLSITNVNQANRLQPL